MSDLLERLAADRRELLRAIGEIAAGAGVEAYLVGGPVRDLVMRRSSVDIDLTVLGDGISFAGRVARELRGVVKGHQRFGTAVIVLPGGVKIDLATARRESYPRPGALPVVAGGSLDEDLRRRDFTMNSMAICVTPDRFGELLDPFGGQRDIDLGVIRVLHEGSFLDDPTRLYRAVRFASRLDFVIDEETASLLARAVDGNAVNEVSGDRIRQELVLILREEDAHLPLRRLSDFELFPAIESRFRPGPRELAMAASMHSAGHSDPEGTVPVPARLLHLERLLALLAGLAPDAARAVMARLGLKGQVARWMESYWRARDEALPALAMSGEMAPSRLRSLLGRFEPPALRILAGMSDSELARGRVGRYLDDLRDVRTLVRGSDLAALGVPPGPRYAEILGAVLDARLDGRVTTRADELRLLAVLAAGGCDQVPRADGEE